MLHVPGSGFDPLGFESVVEEFAVYIGLIFKDSGLWGCRFGCGFGAQSRRAYLLCFLRQCSRSHCGGEIKKAEAEIFGKLPWNRALCQRVRKLLKIDCKHKPVLFFTLGILKAAPYASCGNDTFVACTDRALLTAVIETDLQNRYPPYP